MRALIAALFLLRGAVAQQAQNPSPMVEHTRAHTRLKEESPPGRREKLELGTLFVPAGIEREAPLLFFFHGGTWLPEVAAARNHMAVVTVQAGSGSGTYVRLFENPDRFAALLGGWSAGGGAIRQILKSPAAYDRIAGALIIDGIHTDYTDGKPGPLESKISTENLAIWAQLGRDAIAGKKRAIITHSEIFPGTFASTTETADYLLKEVGVPRTAVLKWGPMGTQQLSEVRSGKFLMMGFAGNSAPDHVDQLHSLPEYLALLN
jgi:hypothetical protein